MMVKSSYLEIYSPAAVCAITQQFPHSSILQTGRPKLANSVSDASKRITEHQFCQTLHELYAMQVS